MEWYWILLIVLAGLFGLALLLTLGISIGLIHYLSYPKHYEAAYCNESDVKKGLIQDQSIFKREPLNLTMRDGYVIHGDYIPAENSKGLIIFTHGYTWCREGDLKYVEMTLPLGYDAYIYDDRGHGENKRVASTMGYKESKDLQEIISYFRKKRGEDAIIGLLGESMGAATTLEVLKYKEKIAFVMEDSGYSSLKTELEFQLRKWPILQKLLPLCDLFLRLAHGYSMRGVDALLAEKDYHGPLLIMHGEADTFVSPECAKKIAAGHDGYHEIHFYPGCDHTLAPGILNKEYTADLQAFLKKIEPSLK